MSTAMIPFEQMQVPAHIAAAFKGATNIPEKNNIPSLSYRGKVWRIVIDGEETIVTNKDGDPVQSIQIIVFDFNKKRSRAYYDGAYEEGKNATPKCWSSDGEKPDAEVKEKQASTCASCQFAVKGSKVTTDGSVSKSTACAPNKRLAVVPATKIEFKPLLLRLAQTSIWDKNAEAEAANGFYAWDQYIDFLRTRGVKSTMGVVTKVKFDLTTAYPKLLFTAVRWLTEDETARALRAAENPAVKDLIDRKYTVSDEAPAAAPVEAAAPAGDPDDEMVIPGEEAPAAPPPAPKAPPKAAAPAALKAPKAPPKTVAKPPPAVEVLMADEPDPTPKAPNAGAGNELSSLLGGWDD